jgi:hypothetical protein
MPTTCEIRKFALNSLVCLDKMRWPAACLDSSAELVPGFAANVFMLTNCRDLAWMNG